MRGAVLLLKISIRKAYQRAPDGVRGGVRQGCLECVTKDASNRQIASSHLLTNR
jgi:hypothetical protein